LVTHIWITTSEEIDYDEEGRDGGGCVVVSGKEVNSILIAIWSEAKVEEDSKCVTIL